MEDIVWFSQVDKNDVELVGGKGANLGELVKLKVPVPEGFIVTSKCYFDNLKSSGAQDRLKSILYNLDVESPTLLQTKAEACQKEIESITLDPNLEKKILNFYRKLSGSGSSYVAVRSSATAEDLPEASFAGQQKTFLNVSGKKNLLWSLKMTWASLFEARAIFYRVQKNYDHFKVGLAVPIQKMVQSEVSGVMFTIDPVTNNKKTMVIEAIFGLGELIVGGQITPDHYEVGKDNLRITSKTVASQDKQLLRGVKGTKLVSISKPYRNIQKLSDEKIIVLAKLGQNIEKHYFFPQDIEWAYEKGKLYIVQTRPVTTTKTKTKIEKVDQEKPSVKLEVLVQGAAASPSIGIGRVIIIKSIKELSRVKKGDVLVTEMTNPDFVPAMRRACAIVTDRGGRTSHAAIVSRELGIACVVGTGNATKKLRSGMVVTVDGAKGIVFKGQLIQKDKNLLPSKISKNETQFKTATKLYVNLAEPQLAGEVAAKNVDGVGLLRAEFMLAQLGVHPKHMIEIGQEEKFIGKLTDGLSAFGRAFGVRPVVYRASDLKSNEYKNLKGGDKYEPKESNPMLGFRGAFRYIKDPDVFKLELEAIKRARQKYKNLHLMIPFVRNVAELTQVKEIITNFGLFKDRNFQFWMMVEIPSNFILLEDFIKLGIDGISIGSNDLTMLILGTDRDNQEVAEEFSELDQAVLWALERIVKTAIKLKVKCSICGQAPSIYPELTQKLVSWGITSISVNPDAIEETRQYIYEAEKKLV